MRLPPVLPCCPCNGLTINVVPVPWQFFDQRRQQLEVFETQLRGLVEKLASANKARSGLQTSIAELQSAFIALSQCDLSSSLRKLYDQAATVQQKLHDLASTQAEHDERVGSLLSVAESYARMCASAKVSPPRGTPRLGRL